MAEIKNVQEGFYDLDEGAYLLLINPTKIPHLVYLQDGRYYSLTYEGVELGYSFAPYFERLIRTGKQIIFLELVNSNHNPFTVFSEYLAAGDNATTCFYPIKQMLLPESKAELIFQLIPELYENKLINSAKHFRLAAHLDAAQNFKLSTYNKADVDAYINSLKSKYAERR